MNYTLNQLRVFVKITELQSITKASEELFLTQPAVSIQLKKFQDQFSIPLTEVVGRKLFITSFGWEIAETAKNILKETEELNYKTSQYQNLLAGKLKLSIVSTGKYVMPYFLSGFIDEHPSVDLSMDVTNKTLVLESLVNNEIDFALMSVVPEDLKINKIELMENHLFLVSKKNSKKQKLNTILENNPLIYRENGSATRMLMEKYFSENTFTRNKKIELTSNEAVKQAVLSGLGVSIMPIIGIRNVLKNEELEIVPAKGLPIVTSWNLVWLKDKKLSPLSDAFIHYISTNKDYLIKKEFGWVDQLIEKK